MNLLLGVIGVIQHPVDRIAKYRRNSWIIYFDYKSHTREGRFGSKVGQIGPKLDKSGTFSDHISVHLAHRAKCTEIRSKKVPDLSNLGPI